MRPSWPGSPGSPSRPSRPAMVLRGVTGSAGLAVLAVLALLALLAFPGPASAHDHLTTMTPGVGSSNATLPVAVSLRFDDAVATIGATLVVLGPSGATISEPHATVVGSRISVPIKPGTASTNGSYVVRYRIISVDGHEVHGSLAFGVGVGSGVAVTPVAPVARAGGGEGAGPGYGPEIGAGGLVLAAVAAMVVWRGRRNDNTLADEET